MDTKSKNTKYPLIVKALCLVLSVLCVFGTLVCALYVVLSAINLPSADAAVTEETYYESTMFNELLREDLSHISNVLYAPQQAQKRAAFAAKRDELVEREVQRYLEEKAAIIRAEVYYVATHYDEIEGDYYYEAYMRDFSTTTTAPDETPTAAAAVPEGVETTVPPTQPESTSAADKSDLSALPTVSVDERAPYNVRYCQSLCNTVTGLDWLAYESLVRDQAFSERVFQPNFDDLGCDDYYNFNYTEAQIRTLFEQQYDRMLQEEFENDAEDDRSRLDALRNLKYLAVAEDGTVYTNMDQSEKSGENILAHKRVILCKDGKVTVKPNDASNAAWLSAAVKEQIASQNATLYLYLEDTFVPGDRYAESKSLFDGLFLHVSPKAALIAGFVFAIVALITFVTLLCLCGHKSGAEGVTLAFIDYVPTDLHLLLSAALMIGAAVLTVILMDSIPNGYALGLGEIGHKSAVALAACGIALVTTVYLIGVEWLTSTVRIKKAGKSFFRGFVLWKPVRLVFRGLRFCLRKIKAGFRFLLDKPKKLRYLPFLACAVYIAGVLFVTLIAVAADEPGPVYLGVPILTVLLVLVTVWFLRMLDRIAEAAETRTDLPQDATRKMPRALRQLAENLSVTNRELEKAVADAVRNERTKAELITNVSHDLKTPLTSVITYVDLLKKCDITDEKALEYLDVLDEKSAKLKRLVEDLIEASKVNTGNITLQRVPLNLAELATQAVTEAASDFEQNDLELKFTPTQCAPTVFADGAKTYRILDNLLSNAKKYSAPGSRVYVKVEEDENFGVFEIKNISREPLDIDPRELMERFVRGDRSRTQDGNGLGLSIAQQLCLLQGGRLEISIDGDLFKATAYLPKHRSAEESVTQV